MSFPHLWCCCIVPTNLIHCNRWEQQCPRWLLFAILPPHRMASSCYYCFHQLACGMFQLCMLMNCCFVHVYMKLLQKQFHIVQNNNVLSISILNTLYKLIYVQKTRSGNIGISRYNFFFESSGQKRFCEIHQLPAWMGRCGIQYLDAKRKSRSVIFG